MGQTRRQIYLSQPISGQLEMRKLKSGIPVAAQVRHAIEDYLQISVEPQHRLFTTRRESLVPAIVPDTLWDALKERKATTGLDLNEQVQIAVALYLQAQESCDAQSQSHPRSESSSPFLPEKPQRELVDRAGLRVTLREELAAMGYEAKSPGAAPMPASHLVPVALIAVRGGDELDNIAEPLRNDTTAEITGRLAERVTEHSFVALANGWGMSNGETELEIRPGDKLLFTPLDEYPRSVRSGDIVLAEVEFNNRRKVRTLKTYEGQRLNATNPAFQGVEFGPNIKEIHVVAVCRGALERVFD